MIDDVQTSLFHSHSIAAWFVCRLVCISFPVLCFASFLCTYFYRKGQQLFDQRTYSHCQWIRAHHPSSITLQASIPYFLSLSRARFCPCSIENQIILFKTSAHSIILIKLTIGTYALLSDLHRVTLTSLRSLFAADSSRTVKQS